MFVSRRQMLHAATCGFGSLALADLHSRAGAVEATQSESLSPLSPKKPHHQPSADQLIFLHMRGGPSAMETFERKPELDKQAKAQAKQKGGEKRKKGEC